MSLFTKRSDVKNHLSARHHKKNDENRPLSQPDAPVIAPVEPDAIKANSSDPAEDFNSVQSSSSPSIASNDGSTSAVDPQVLLPSRSVRE